MRTFIVTTNCRVDSMGGWAESETLPDGVVPVAWYANGLGENVEAALEVEPGVSDTLARFLDQAEWCRGYSVAPREYVRTWKRDLERFGWTQHYADPLWESQLVAM